VNRVFHYFDFRIQKNVIYFTFFLVLLSMPYSLLLANGTQLRGDVGGSSPFESHQTRDSKSAWFCVWGDAGCSGTRYDFDGSETGSYCTKIYSRLVRLSPHNYP